MESVLPQLKPGGECVCIRKIKLQIKDVKEIFEKKILLNYSLLLIILSLQNTHLIEACSVSYLCINTVSE